MRYGEGRVYAHLAPTSEVERSFPIDPRFKKKNSPGKEVMHETTNSNKNKQIVT